jgi:hypothetical protein
MPTPAPPGYAVRRLLPEDAAGVTECVRAVYGDTYLHRELYHPDEIARFNAAGELVSVVALDDDGRVVAHYALERPGLGPVAEEGEALVLPEHRHHHLMEAMRDLLEHEAAALSLTGLFGQAVTNHVFTQKVHERFGLAPCAVSLGAGPKSFHNMPEPLPQRMSLLIGFKYLRRPTRVTAHVPEHHWAVCTRIYESLGVRAEFGEPAPVAVSGEVAIDFDPAIGAATVRVKRVGSDTAGAVRSLRRELCGPKGAEAVFLELPLAQAGTPDLCRAAEADGFFFSGVGPGFAADGDALRLQYLAVGLDAALLQIESAPGRDLVDYVERERRRVGAAPP